LSLTDHATGKEEKFEFAEGIRLFVEWLNADRRPLNREVLVIRGEDEGVRYEVGLQWCLEEDGLSKAFVNGEQTRFYAGTQISGLKAAVTRSLNGYIRKYFPEIPVLKNEDIKFGLTAIVSVWLANPQFLGAIKGQLNNKKAKRVIEKGVGRALPELLRTNPEDGVRIIKTAVAEREAREACAAKRRTSRKVDNDSE